MRTASIAMLIVGLCLAACTTQEAVVRTGTDAEVIFDRLHRVDNTRAAMAFVDPDVDFSRFTKIMLDELDVSHIEITQPPRSTGSRVNREFVLEDRDREMLQSAWREIMVRELESNGYPVVETAGEDVLRVTGAIRSLAPTAPRDDSRSRGAGRNHIVTDGAGSIVMAAMFHDSASGEVVAILQDARNAANNAWGINNRVSNTADVRRIFSTWARQFRARLDIIHG